MRKVWIEVGVERRLESPASAGHSRHGRRRSSPRASPARAPAPAIVHAHAYDDGGPQTFDWQVYARIIEGIRAKIDVPVYPSDPDGRQTSTATQPRASPISRRWPSAACSNSQWSIPAASTSPWRRRRPARRRRATYLNPEAHIRHALDLAKRMGFHPAFAIYEPGFTRAGAALARPPASRRRSTGSCSPRPSPSASRPNPMGARGPSRVAGGRGASRAVDDRGPRRRCPAADRRDGGARRSCARRPRRRALWARR